MVGVVVGVGSVDVQRVCSVFLRLLVVFRCWWFAKFLDIANVVSEMLVIVFQSESE